jgi:hypothetical protein
MRRFKPQTTARRSTSAGWTVPPHLQGLACQCCGYFFQDGETHGELDFTTGALTCKTRVLQVTNRPSRALVRVGR